MTNELTIDYEFACKFFYYYLRLKDARVAEDKVGIEEYEGYLTKLLESEGLHVGEDKERCFKDMFLHLVIHTDLSI